MGRSRNSWPRRFTVRFRSPLEELEELPHRAHRPYDLGAVQIAVPLDLPDSLRRGVLFGLEDRDHVRRAFRDAIRPRARPSLPIFSHLLVKVRREEYAGAQPRLNVEFVPF